jgi:serine kinase of HPr protein (carbohydrate metabolism regulator)
MIAHAGLIALWDRGRWRGVLIEGPSGSGKSDLALRALDHGFRLVADDRVELWTTGGVLWGRAPDVLSGLLEARGLGVMGTSALPFSRVEMAARMGRPERTPEPATCERLGVRLALWDLDPFEASAPAKLKLALSSVDAGGGRGI